jgi:hypothetical protein
MIFKLCPGIALIVALSALLCGPATARDAAEKRHEVDAGSFAIFVNGQRIATETFRIEQGATSSTATSEFKSESGQRTVQRAVLQITAAGELRRYEWHEISPGKAEITVEPADQFILERVIPNPPAKPAEQPFVLPASTMVLDDYFFSQREILVWRYLAEACGGKLQQCRPGRTSFGVLVPQQRTTTVVTLQYTGIEKVNVGRNERELRRISLKAAEEDEWILYLDSNLKLVRIDIPGQKSQVLRQ